MQTHKDPFNVLNLVESQEAQAALLLVEMQVLLKI